MLHGAAGKGERGRDVVVVGAGTAGRVLANRLSQRGARVPLLGWTSRRAQVPDDVSDLCPRPSYHEAYGRAWRPATCATTGDPAASRRPAPRAATRRLPTGPRHDRRPDGYPQARVMGGDPATTHRPPPRPAARRPPTGPRHDRRLGGFPQARVMGGSSALMGVVSLRELPQDHDDWAAAGATGWAWDDVPTSATGTRGCR
ncbi:GMC family oxidoreductase N-terminal domain-containing protein [Nonomuraea terrae]|uniref:GMC family oxidoreductase N-terminal domain-containing protein n=1 Tax=Nonomuraea terrae TaxID=2530383 RepID=UPI0037B4C933